jgi:NADH-quinone oxidoreductase subunit N
MNVLLNAMLPEIILTATACLLFLLGMSNKVLSRKLAAELALLSLVCVFLIQCFRTAGPTTPVIDSGGAVYVQSLSQYIKLITAGVGILLVLLNMPTNKLATGGSAIETGTDTAEYFALLLLSLAGLCVVASANDLILLFLGIELASIPTYIMVSISRPLPVAQEAGLKYFFLGAMSAAIMLFGFSYLYGVTGSTSLDRIAGTFSYLVQPGQSIALVQHTPWSPWLVMAVLMLIGGFAFKIAAVPLHSYAGDVYQGAATPVTAFLSFVPKTSGFVALIKVLYAVSGGTWDVPLPIINVLWAIAALTMTVGNVLGLVQFNIKRTLAYSSVAHTGYMLVGITALVSSHGQLGIQNQALGAVLFYLAAYGITNVAAFGVLQLLPSRHDRPATSAETFEDIAGQGRKHMGLGLAMAVACLSLTGIPLTAGFIGKIYLALPAGHANLIWLSIILWSNAAISAGYYLRIIAVMFLRPEPTHLMPGASTATPMRLVHPPTVVIAVLLSVVITLLLGSVPAAYTLLSNRVQQAAVMQHTVIPVVEEFPIATHPQPSDLASARK